MNKAILIKAGMAVLMFAVFATAASQQSDKDKGFSGLGMGLGNLSRLSKAQTRSVSPENFTGEKGKAAMSTDGPALSAARDLGQGWKVSPYVRVPAGETFVMADVKGEGAIQQIWLTPAGTWRHAILRIYWDGETEPSVECPVGDFFACGWGQYAQVSSLPVCVNPGSAFNCYWEMPFRKGFKMTIENIAAKPRAGEAPTTNQFTVYYQVNYTLTDVPDDAAYFHAQFRRVNPLPFKDVYTILDGVKGQGHYVGTYMAWGVHNNGWWGEGELKFYHGRRFEVPLDRLHRHRGLFLRLVRFRRQGPGRLDPVPRVHDAVRGPAAGHPRRRPLPGHAAVRTVPLAHHGSGPLREGFQGDDPGAGLAIGRALPAAPGRHRVGRVLVPDRAARQVPQASGKGLSGHHLSGSRRAGARRRGFRRAAGERQEVG